MKTFNFTDKVDYPFDTNIFAHIQEDYKLYEKVISMLLTGAVPGTGNYIVYGVEEVGGNLTAGLLLINGELIRFEQGVGVINDDNLIRIDTDTKTETVDGIVYTTYTEKIGRVQDMTGIPTVDFVRLSKLMSESLFNSINTDQHSRSNFVPFAGIDGVTVHHASVIKRPFELAVKVQFTVDMAEIASPGSEISITGWQLGLAYGTENSMKMVGHYALYHIDGSDIEVRQNMGWVTGRTGGILKLNKPFTAFESTGIEHATWDDLAYASDQTFGKYRIELEVIITRPNID